MSSRKAAVLALLAAAMIATLLFGAQAQASSTAIVTLATNQSEFAPGTQNMGWWDDAGVHFVGNDNYEVGNAPDLGAEILRNFFTFDGSLVSGCAKSARLQIPIGLGSGDFGGVTTGGVYSLHAVSTDPVTLNTTGGPDVSIFTDLGTGTSYGSTFEPTAGPYSADAFIVPLNANAVAGLNAAILSDTFWSVGGMIAGEPDDTSLFGFTPVSGPAGDRPVKLLILTGSC